MNFLRPLAAAVALLLAPAALAQAAPRPAPKLLVVIAVDQLSADLFAEYRAQFAGGFARLLQGAVFNGYQSHATTETCPGHSTILTGSRPSRTGIVGNAWIDQTLGRENPGVNCVADTTRPGSLTSNYTVSDRNLRVPTLGEWMLAANPATRVVSVAGKDRSAVMMGGHRVNELWWWGGSGFVSHAGRTAPAMVTRMNANITGRLAEAQDALEVPAFCQARDRAIPVGANQSVGAHRYARAAGDVRGFRASPEFDEAILALAAGLIVDMRLGLGDATDIVAIGASATDHVGHSYGTEGVEMCLQLLRLDESLGQFFAVLDRTGVDYAVALTADHGGHDAPERLREQAAPDAERVDAQLSAEAVGREIGAALGLAGPVLFGDAGGDVYIDRAIAGARRAAVLAEAVRRFSAHRQVHSVFTRAQIVATPSPRGPPGSWTLIERVRAAFDAERSGDLFVALRPHVTPIPVAGPGYVAAHGSIWDYDRRVPILFWRSGMTGFENPLGVETADIAPTLAALIGVPVPVEIDGRCLDLDSGPGDSCGR